LITESRHGPIFFSSLCAGIMQLILMTGAPTKSKDRLCASHSENASQKRQGRTWAKRQNRKLQFNLATARPTVQMARASAIRPRAVLRQPLQLYHGNFRSS